MHPFRPLQAVLGLVLASIVCLIATKGSGASMLWWFAVPVAAVAAGFLWENKDWSPSELFSGDSDDSDGD